MTLSAAMSSSTTFCGVGSGAGVKGDSGPTLSASSPSGAASSSESLSSSNIAPDFRGPSGVDAGAAGIGASSSTFMEAGTSVFLVDDGRGRVSACENATVLRALLDANHFWR